jgi:hypothetical protein
MATSTIGANPGRNDWMWDQSMKQWWVQNGGSAFSTGGNNLGRMIQVTSYLASFSGGSGGAVAWKNAVASFDVTTDSIGTGNQSTGAGGANHTAGADVPFLGSDGWEFGGYVANGVFVNYEDNGGSTFVKASAISNASGGTDVSAYNGRAGQGTAFGTYFIVETYVRRSGAWTKVFIYVRRSGAWNLPDIYVRRSGGWTQVGLLPGELDWKREMPVILAFDGNWEYGIMRWDYDRPRYLGVGAPESVVHDVNPRRDWLVMNSSLPIVRRNISEGVR